MWGFNDLPNEILTLVMEYLSPHDLAMQCSRVNKSWNMLQNQDSLWRAHCRRLWSVTANMPPPPPERAAPTSVVRSSYSPATTTPPPPPFVDRMYPRALMVYTLLTWSEKMQVLEMRQRRRPAPSESAPMMLLRALYKSESMLEYMPEAWRRYRCVRSKWKANYVYSWFDLTARPHNITRQELCQAEWIFLLRRHPNAYSATAKFHLNGEVEMHPNPAGLAQPLLFWELSVDRSYVTLNHFQRLSVNRATLEGGGGGGAFHFANSHVVLVQSNCPGFVRATLTRPLRGAVWFEDE